MSLVTAQGIQARHALDEHIVKLGELIIEILANGPQSINDVISKFESEDDDVVREALWRLLNLDKVTLNDARALQLVAPSR